MDRLGVAAIWLISGILTNWTILKTLEYFLVVWIGKLYNQTDKSLDSDTVNPDIFSVWEIIRAKPCGMDIPGRRRVEAAARDGDRAGGSPRTAGHMAVR